MSARERLAALIEEGSQWGGAIALVLSELSESDLASIARQAEQIAHFVRAEQRQRAAGRDDAAGRLYRQRRDDGRR